MKKQILLGGAAVLMAACSSNDFVGDQALGEANGAATISFNSGVGTVTRANKTGADAATSLGNQFIVWGEKNETSGSAATAGNLVFNNYQVNYTANTAYTTTSNTKDWEYVGAQHSGAYQTNITPSTDGLQTVKYWDYGAANGYTFTAFSAKQADITDGKIKVTKTQSGTTEYDKGYTVTVGTGADLSKLYFADRVKIAQGSGKDRTAVNAYGGNVTFNFRNVLSKVRVGMYETNPGYAVSAVKFYKTDDTEATGTFCGKVPNIKAAGYTGTLTVTYNDNTVAAIKNQPKLTVTGTPASDLLLGGNINAISTSSPLATSASAPTWDTSGGAYTAVLPQAGNTTNLKLKVDYTLYNSVTGETIQITGKTAEVPAEYLQWKPNYQYTYLFKITDDDLYPITFDAVEIVSEDGQAEYITTVTEPSITTFGVSGSSYVHGGSDYAAGSDVYATIVDGHSVPTITLGSNVNVYLATTTNATSFPITEASVAHAIANPSGNITCTSINDDASVYFTAVPAVVTSVPTENGGTVNIKALKLTGVKATTATTALVVEYKNTIDDKFYKVIRVYE